MFWTPLMKSFFISVALTIISNTAQISGEPKGKGLTLASDTTPSVSVYSGWYRVQTPVSLLINTTGTLVTYLPSCYHGSLQAYTIELFKGEGGTKKVIASDNLRRGLDRDTRLLWPSSALNASDSGTYRCRFQPPTANVDSQESYILHVVVPVNITQLEIGKVFVSSSFLVTCCADGYPEPSVAINGTGPSYVNTTNSSGIVTTCRTVNLSAPMEYGKVYVMCEAELAPFKCTAVPPAAHTLCAATTKKTNATKTTTANKRSCVPLDKLINGHFKCSDANNLKSVCELICNSGFVAKPNKTSQCLGTGRFSLPVPVCEDIDECATQPCENHGTCHNTVGNYTCTCPPGWAGRKCTEDVDECATKPCKNGGTCTNTVGSYTCMCAPGWTGRICAEDVDECKTGQHNCSSIEICVNTEGMHTCNCSTGYFRNFTICSAPECQHGSLNGSKCDCDFGWQGDACDRKCTYGNLVGSKCDCIFGFKGDACDKADWGVMIGSIIAGCVVELIIFVLTYVLYRKLKKCPDSVPPGMNRKNFKEWEERDLELDRLEQEAHQNSNDTDGAAGTSASSGSYSGEEYARLMRSDQKQQEPTSAAGGETYAQLNIKIPPQYEDANPGHPINIEMAHLPAQYDRLDRDGKPAPPKTTTNINYEYTKANFPAPSEAAGNEAELNYAALEKKEPSTFDNGLVAAGKTVYSQIVPMSQQNQSESEN